MLRRFLQCRQDADLALLGLRLMRDIRQQQRRQLSQLIQVPAIFAGLTLALWAWKCLMLVVFQNKIVYMPYIARYDTTYDALFSATGPWNVANLNSTDGTRLRYLEYTKHPHTEIASPRKCTTVLYLQGNASSIPARLPYLGKTLNFLSSLNHDRIYKLHALSYRGYWFSRGRPSEIGVLRDVEAMLNRLSSEVFQSCKSNPLDEVEIVIWGHSIGAGFTILSLRKALDIIERDTAGTHIRVHVRLVLETPFVNTRSVLHELYPQRWLPYRYLGPFLQTQLDMARALEGLRLDQLKRVHLTCVHIIAASDDEILGAPDGLPAQVHQLVQAKLGSQGVSITFDSIKGLHANLLTMTSFQSRLAQRLTEKVAS